MKIALHRLLLALLLLLSLQLARPVAAATLEITQAEAVAAAWDAKAPPATGWVPVSLMDFWDARWPQHDGVVWYRLRWRQDDATQPVGLLVNYLCLAGAIYVNGSLVARDTQLTEPLSRAWIKPQYFLLSAPLLRQGENTLLVRVSGLAAYQPGFGTVVVGEPAAVKAQYESGLFKRFQIKLVNVAMSAVLGGIFLMLWLLRRRDTTYGWFALTELAGSVHGFNFLAASPWPFSSTDGWQSFIAASYMVAAVSYAVFLLRYGERRMPRLEKILWAFVIVAVLLAALAPAWMGAYRTFWFALGGLVYYVSIGWFLLLALRVPRADYRVLAACLLLPVLSSFHDFALFLGWVRSDTYLLNMTSLLTLAGIAFSLAYRFVNAMHKVENFNVELQREVDAATRQLGDTLAREHALALANSRAGERLQLTRDLHDGFGGTLVGAIARLELAPDTVPKAQVVDLLKEMRDDLRLVIDSTTREGRDLPALLAPLRHRSESLLEAAGIDSHWQLQHLDGIELDSARSLDLLRLLQEALTNVFKHSRARRVEVTLQHVDGQLQLQVRDDGQGLAPASLESRGAGLDSMQQRAQRLGGQLQMESAASGTGLRLAFPLAV
ncbi:MAG TPA: ATP-binding protein [Moraxellaceae bacterium]